MSDMEDEINKHENIIIHLKNELENISDLNDKNILNEKIKLEQEFIISLYKIKC